MNQKIFILLIWLGASKMTYSQNDGVFNMLKANDTSFVGKLLDQDSILSLPDIIRSGRSHYYGVHHLKVALINYVDSLIYDTIIIVYVYNTFTEFNQYLKKFELKLGRNYLFTVSKFTPCFSDFPKIQGLCDSISGDFLPIRNKLIKKYKNVYRVIYASEWRGEVKEQK